MFKKQYKDHTQSTQKYIPFAEIKDDTIIMKDGSIRAILEVISFNFSLKSTEEQEAIIYSYQGFLNALEFPIQILIKSKKLNIDNYINDLKEKAEAQQNNLLKIQTLEYINYISKLVEYADIMEKKFYIVVGYESSLFENAGIDLLKNFKKFWNNINPDDTKEKYRNREKSFEDAKKGLTQRINIVQSGLTNLGLQVQQLKNKDLINLLYITYNPLISLEQKLNTEMKSIQPYKDL